jgi:hypothetical protein
VGFFLLVRLLHPPYRNSAAQLGRGCGDEPDLGDDVCHAEPDDLGPAQLAGASYSEYGGVRSSMMLP